MLSIGIRSRIGNFTLVVLGALYTIAGAALLVWTLRMFWGTQSSLTVRLYTVEAAAIGYGAFVARAAFRNLGLELRRRPRVQAALSH